MPTPNWRLAVAMSNAPKIPLLAVVCPVCRKPVRQEFAPFCGQGCKDRDLLQWLGDGYRIPGPATVDDDDNSGLDSGD